MKKLLILPVMALALGLMGMVPAMADTQGRVTVQSRIRSFEGKLECAQNLSSKCAQVTVAGDLVWDVVKVNANGADPTGSVEFRFFNNGSCSSPRAGTQIVTLTGPVAFHTMFGASDVKTLPAGQYSYRALYRPDAAAKAQGIDAPSWGIQGPCEVLIVYEAPTNE